jgi:hypothetical protein
VLAWPCGDPDILSGDGEINLSFPRRTECPLYGWGLLVPAGPGLGLWLGGTAEQLAEKLQNQRIGALKGRDLSRALRSFSKTYGAAEAVPLQKL